MLPQRSQVSIRVARMSTGILWSHGRGITPPFRMERGISRCFSSWSRKCGFLHVATAPEGASHVVSVKSGILSSCEGPLGIPLKLVQATRASC